MTRLRSSLDSPPRRPGRRRGFALLIAISLAALGMGVAFVMLHSSDLGIRSTVRDDLDVKATRAAESAVQLGIDVLKRRPNDPKGGWQGTGSEFSGTWLDGTSYRIRYIAGDASLTSGSSDYVYYPYRVTVEATVSVVDPSDQTAVSKRISTAVLELVPTKMQSVLTGWGERSDYAVYQFKRAARTATPSLEPPFQFVGKTKLSETVTTWGAAYFSDDARRQPYMTGLKTLALAGTERRPFVGTLEYKISDQPSAFKTDVTTRLGLTATDSSGVTQVVSPGSAATTYRLYYGGPTYSIPSFSATYGSQAHDFTTTADPTTNPLGVWRMTTSITIKSDSHVNGMLMATTSSSSLTVDGDRVSVAPPKAMCLNQRTLGVALQSVCVTDNLTVKKDADDVSFGGTVGVWNLFQIEEDHSSQDVLIEGGLQCHNLSIGPRKDFKDMAFWATALSTWNTYVANGGTLTFPQWVEFAPCLLPSAPSIKIKKDVTGAESKFLFDLSRPLYDYPDATSGLSWRLVRLTPPT